MQRLSGLCEKRNKLILRNRVWFSVWQNTDSLKPSKHVLLVFKMNEQNPKAVFQLVTLKIKILHIIILQCGGRKRHVMEHEMGDE